MKRLVVLFDILCFLALALTACNNSVNDMLEDYNEGFKTGYVTVSDSNLAEETLEPGDEGFSQSSLLFAQYTVFDIGTLNLAAPASCKSFSWVLTDPNAEDTTEPLKVTFYDGSSTTIRRTQDYVVYMPESGLEIGHTYYLTLTVIGKDGRTYSDLAQIFTVEFHVEVDS